MKLTKRTIIIFGVIILLTILMPYFYTFRFGLSSNSQDWAHFGTYIGGTLGPIGAFLAFWGLIQQNAMYRENAETENLSNKLLSLDNHIVSIMVEICGAKVISYNEKEDFNLSRLLISDDPLAKKLIEEKLTSDQKVNLDVKLIGDKGEHNNYRKLMSLESKLLLMNEYLLCTSSRNDKEHYNNKYQYLLKDMHKKNWLDFQLFG